MVRLTHYTQALLKKDAKDGLTFKQELRLMKLLEQQEHVIRVLVNQWYMDNSLLPPKKPLR